MRQQIAVVATLALLPLTAGASWVAISTEAGKQVEIDPASLRTEDTGKKIVTGRIQFAQELVDPRTTAIYRSIETVTRYDCTTRTYATLSRSWRKADGEPLRNEEIKNPVELPVRSGSIEDKMLREVCRPAAPARRPANAAQLAEKAKTAGQDLRRVNEEMVRKETAKAASTPAAAAKPAPTAATTPKPATAAAPAATSPKPAAQAPAPSADKSATPPQSSPTPRPKASVHWSYAGEGGPEHWGKLKPEYALCAKGKRQSPIDIRDGIRVDQPAIEFAWKPSFFRIVDNGHSVQVSLTGSSISLLGKPYHLIDIHFHRPAEERVNGRRFEMGAHFVHRAEDGRLAVVAVLMDPGAENPFIQTLWNHLPLERNETVAPPGVAIDPATFLPEDRRYYTYMGSLTTPPCTENVQWLVLKQPVQVSAEQIAIFARLHPANARPVQPQHGRLIKESR